MLQIQLHTSYRDDFLHDNDDDGACVKAQRGIWNKTE